MFGQPYFAQAPIGAVLVFEPHVVDAFARYTASLNAFARYDTALDCFGKFDLVVDAFANEGEV